MTISIGGSANSQLTTEINKAAADRISSSQENRSHERADGLSAIETTSLVSGAASLAALTATALAASEVRSDKVEQLRHAIKTSSYTVEPTGIADTMLMEWKQTR